MRNPYLNSAFALGYIALVITTIFKVTPLVPQEETIFIPMMMLSLLVFSVALMGFLFAYRPLVLLFEGKKTEAVVFFFKTLGTFAALALIFVLLWLITVV